MKPVWRHSPYIGLAYIYGIVMASATAFPGLAVADDPVSMTTGAILHPCVAPAIPGDGKQWSCGQVTVPYSYTDPNSDTFAVSFSVLSPEGSQINAARTLFVNPGGPGTAATWFPAQMNKVLPPELSDFTLVAVQPRGLSDSGGLDCVPAEYAVQQSAHIPVCDTAKTDLLESISTENNARDMDAVREALGIQSLNYYGVSYGSMLGAVYSTLYPERSSRMILDSAINPQWVWLDEFAEESTVRQQRLNALISWIAQHDNEFQLGSSPDAAWSSWADVVRSEAGGLVNLPYPPSGDPLGAIAASIRGHMQNLSSRVEAILTGNISANPSYTVAYTVAALASDSEWNRYASWLAQAKATRILPPLPSGDLTLPRDPNETIVAVATICNENASSTAEFGQPLASLNDLLGGSLWDTDSLMNRAGDLCRGWAVPHQTIPALTPAEPGSVLVLQSTDDPVTPAPGAYELSEQLGATLITYPGGSHGVLLSAVSGSADTVSRFLRDQ